MILEKGKKWEEGGLPSLPPTLALLPNTFSTPIEQTLQLPTREVPSSARKGPELAVASGQGVPHGSRKQMKFRIG